MGPAGPYYPPGFPEQMLAGSHSGTPMTPHREPETPTTIPRGGGRQSHYAAASVVSRSNAPGAPASYMSPLVSASSHLPTNWPASERMGPIRCFYGRPRRYQDMGEVELVTSFSDDEWGGLQDDDFVLGGIPPGGLGIPAWKNNWTNRVE